MQIVELSGSRLLALLQLPRNVPRDRKKTEVRQAPLAKI